MRHRRCRRCRRYSPPPASLPLWDRPQFHTSTAQTATHMASAAALHGSSSWARGRIRGSSRGMSSGGRSRRSRRSRRGRRRSGGRRRRRKQEAAVRRGRPPAGSGPTPPAAQPTRWVRRLRAVFRLIQLILQTFISWTVAAVLALGGMTTFWTYLSGSFNELTLRDTAPSFAALTITTCENP